MLYSWEPTTVTAILYIMLYSMRFTFVVTTAAAVAFFPFALLSCWFFIFFVHFPSSIFLSFRFISMRSLVVVVVWYYCCLPLLLLLFSLVLLLMCYSTATAAAALFPSQFSWCGTTSQSERLTFSNGFGWLDKNYYYFLVSVAFECLTCNVVHCVSVFVVHMAFCTCIHNIHAIWYWILDPYGSWRTIRHWIAFENLIFWSFLCPEFSSIFWTLCCLIFRWNHWSDEKNQIEQFVIDSIIFSRLIRNCDGACVKKFGSDFSVYQP